MRAERKCEGMKLYKSETKRDWHGDGCLILPLACMVQGRRDGLTSLDLQNISSRDAL